MVVLLFYGHCVLLCGSFETFVTFSHNFEIVLNYIVFILIFLVCLCFDAVCTEFAAFCSFWGSFVFHLFVSIWSSLASLCTLLHYCRYFWQSFVGFSILMLLWGFGWDAGSLGEFISVTFHLFCHNFARFLFWGSVVLILSWCGPFCGNFVPYFNFTCIILCLFRAIFHYFVNLFRLD